MARFASVYQESGVDAAGRFITVGWGSTNVVVLHDAKGLDLQFDPRMLDVREVRRDQFPVVSHALNHQFVEWNSTAGPAAQTYRGAVHNAINFSGPRVAVARLARRWNDPDSSNHAADAYFPVSVPDVARRLDDERSAAGAPGANPEGGRQNCGEKEDRPEDCGA